MCTVIHLLYSKSGVLSAEDLVGHCCFRYNEIAQHAFDTLDQGGTGSHSQPKISAKGKPPGSRSNNSAVARWVIGVSHLDRRLILATVGFCRVTESC